MKGVLKMTLEEKKTAAKAAYKEAKEKYRKHLNSENWITYYNELCETRRLCRLLGVII